MWRGAVVSCHRQLPTCEIPLWGETEPLEAITAGSRKVPVQTYLDPGTVKDSNFNLFTIEMVDTLILLFTCISAIHCVRNQSRFPPYDNIPGLNSPRLEFIHQVHQSSLGGTSYGMQCCYLWNLPTSSVNLNPGAITTKPALFTGAGISSHNPPFPFV